MPQVGLWVEVTPFELVPRVGPPLLAPFGAGWVASKHSIYAFLSTVCDRTSLLGAGGAGGTRSSSGWARLLNEGLHPAQDVNGALQGLDG